MRHLFKSIGKWDIYLQFLENIQEFGKLLVNYLLFKPLRVWKRLVYLRRVVRKGDGAWCDLNRFCGSGNISIYFLHFALFQFLFLFSLLQLLLILRVIALHSCGFFSVSLGNVFEDFS